MSRIRGIEVKVQKEILQTRKYGLNEILKRKNNEVQDNDSKEDGEKKHIGELLQKLPKLDKIFEVHRKIGEGTFSTVYLGSLRRQVAAGAARRLFAIKHLAPGAHPARVLHELRCLQDMGGKNHVIGVDLCLRHLDTVVFIMPYIPHRKFSEYVGQMDAQEVRGYMRALLTALRHVHSFGVIHRDVKPSNFLYDRDNRRYLLVDFGLAQRLCPGESAPAPPAPHAAPPPAHDNSRKRPREQEEEETSPEAKRAALDLSVSSLPRAAPAPAPPAAAAPACQCAGRAAVCAACGARPAARAPRAGTQGYRPPEVLLKVSAQTTAVDMWAAGVVLASALSGRYPFLRAADDVSALAELADLLGTRALCRAAHALGRRVVVSAPRRGVCLRRLAAQLRGGGGGGCGAGARCECGEAGAGAAGFPGAAFELARALLAPEPRRRLSAAAALAHPFIAG